MTSDEHSNGETGQINEYKSKITTAMKSKFCWWRTLIKVLWWDIQKKENYCELLFKILNIIPGESGDLLRGYAFGKAMKSAGVNSKINSGSIIFHLKEMEIGDNFVMNTYCVLNAGGGLVCGNNVLIGPSVKIWTINHEFSDINIPINQQGWSKEGVSIGNDVWLAANVIILPGTTIPDGVVIGANSTVTKSAILKPYHLYFGNPIREIKMRSN